MTNELIIKLLPVVKRSIVCEKLVFVETKKFDLPGLRKSLFVTFAARNGLTGWANKVTYSVHDGQIDYTLWPDILK
jgi:hypothetical protein